MKWRKADGDALRVARLELGCSQASFGALVDVSAVTVMRWENVKAVPSYSRRLHLVTAVARTSYPVAVRLARLLGVAPPDAPAITRAPDEVDAIVRDAIFRAADDADITASRARAFASRFLHRLGATGLGIDDASAALARTAGKASTATPG